MSATDHVHGWYLKKVEFGISKAHCPECGTTKYVADLADAPDVVQRVKFLNKQEQGGVVMSKPNTKSAIPPKPASRYEMKRYYEDNKEAILEDLAELGEKEMLRRWGISQATWLSSKKGSLIGIAVRWGIVSQEGTRPPNGMSQLPEGMEPCEKQVPDAARVNKAFPAFPPFDASWPTEVQIEWIITYRELARP